MWKNHGNNKKEDPQNPDTKGDRGKNKRKIENEAEAKAKVKHWRVRREDAKGE